MDTNLATLLVQLFEGQRLTKYPLSLKRPNQSYMFKKNLLCGNLTRVEDFYGLSKRSSPRVCSLEIIEKAIKSMPCYLALITKKIKLF